MGHLPPFYVGQRVICINTSCTGNDKEGALPSQVLIKNNEYIITRIDKFCCNWVVNVGVTVPNINNINYCICSSCRGKYLNPTNEWYFLANRFSPILENFKSIELSKIYNKIK